MKLYKTDLNFFDSMSMLYSQLKIKSFMGQENDYYKADMLLS